MTPQRISFVAFIASCTLMDRNAEDNMACRPGRSSGPSSTHIILFVLWNVPRLVLSASGSEAMDAQTVSSEYEGIVMSRSSTCCEPEDLQFGVRSTKRRLRRSPASQPRNRPRVPFTVDLWNNCGAAHDEADDVDQGTTDRILVNLRTSHFVLRRIYIYTLEHQYKTVVRSIESAFQQNIPSPTHPTQHHRYASF
jgi:hypothetical protein